MASYCTVDHIQRRVIYVRLHWHQQRSSDSKTSFKNVASSTFMSHFHSNSLLARDAITRPRLSKKDLHRIFARLSRKHPFVHRQHRPRLSTQDLHRIFAGPSRKHPSVRRQQASIQSHQGVLQHYMYALIHRVPFPRSFMSTNCFARLLLSMVLGVLSHKRV